MPIGNAAQCRDNHDKISCKFFIGPRPIAPPNLRIRDSKPRRRFIIPHPPRPGGARYFPSRKLSALSSNNESNLGPSLAREVPVITNIRPLPLAIR